MHACTYCPKLMGACTRCPKMTGAAAPVTPALTRALLIGSMEHIEPILIEPLLLIVKIDISHKIIQE